jgi:hypothetical protein
MACTARGACTARRTRNRPPERGSRDHRRGF